MARKTPLITVSAVVTPAMLEEIHTLAKAKKMSRSQMVRQLLEERLTQRANERNEDAYGRLEKRLAIMENRFAGLLMKVGKASAQSLYLTQVGLKYGHQRQEQQYLDKHWENSQSFAGQYLETKKKRESRAEET